MAVEVKPDVSIIVTVHNAEKYLVECLHSVCDQTYQNIEIICVDGGSTDGSPDILKKFAQNDWRVRIINDSNTSYGHKLNIGFEEARGNYIGILESDDKLCLDMVENLYRIACQYRPDVVGGNVFRSFNYKDKMIGYEVQTYQDPFYYNRLIIKDQEPIKYAHGAIFASLYKKSFLKEKNIRVNETQGAAFQDQGFSFMTDILAETAYYINKPVYRYRVDNPESSVYDDKKVYEISWEMQFIEHELEEKNITDSEIWNEFWRNKYSAYIHNMNRLSNIGKRKFKTKFRIELEKDIKQGIFEVDILDKDKKDILLGFWEDDEYFEKHGTNMVEKTEEKVFKILNCALNRSVVIFGAGKRGYKLLTILENICSSLENNSTQIKCFCDNSDVLQGESIAGKKVISVEQAVKDFSDAVYIIANVRHYESMFNQLRKYGISKDRICFFN